MDMMSQLFNFALANDIGVEATHELPSDDPSLAIPERRQILLNLGWRRPAEIPYIFAHEIAHVLCGAPGVQYFHPDFARTANELDADHGGIDILFNLCQDDDFEPEYFNYVDFMEKFMIPTCYENYVKRLVA